MSCSVTSVFTFKIESTFDEWAAIFDSAEADKRHSEFDIKPLFRGVSKEDPQKIIVIHQAPEGNVQKFVEANGDWMATHRVDLSNFGNSTGFSLGGTPNSFLLLASPIIRKKGFNSSNFRSTVNQ